MTTGTDTATELVKIANQEKITKVILGKPRGSFLTSIIRKSPAYKILNENNNFDIYFVSPLFIKEIDSTTVEKKVYFKDLKVYLFSLITIIPVFLVGLFLFYILKITSFETFFILSPITTALLWGTYPSLFISIINILVYDFFFVEPIHTFTIARVEYIFDLIIFFITSIIIGQLTKVVKHQQEALKIRLEQVQLLEEMSRELLKVSMNENIYKPTSKRGTQILRNKNIKIKALEDISNISIRYLVKVINVNFLILFKNEKEDLNIFGKNNEKSTLSTNDYAIASWSFSYSEMAGKGTKNLTGTNYFFIPISSNNKSTLGILAIEGDYKKLLPNERFLISSIIKLTSDVSNKYFIDQE